MKSSKFQHNQQQNDPLRQTKRSIDSITNENSIFNNSDHGELKISQVRVKHRKQARIQAFTTNNSPRTGIPEQGTFLRKLNYGNISARAGTQESQKHLIRRSIDIRQSMNGLGHNDMQNQSLELPQLRSSYIQPKILSKRSPHQHSGFLNKQNIQSTATLNKSSNAQTSPEQSKFSFKDALRTVMNRQDSKEYHKIIEKQLKFRRKMTEKMNAPPKIRIQSPSGDTNEEQLTKEFQLERNHSLYEMLKQNKIFVIPDQRIQKIEKMPHFSIIFDDLKILEKDEAQKSKKKISRGEFDTRFFKTNRDFYEYLNKVMTEQRFKKQGKNDEFFSESLAIKKKKNQKLVEDYGYEDEYKQKVMESYKKQSKQDVEKSKLLDEILGEESGIPNFNSPFQKRRRNSRDNTNPIDTQRQIQMMFKQGLKDRVQHVLKNQELKHIYHDEKRKLEVEILKDYYKEKVQQRILSINGGLLRPKFKYEEIKEKYHSPKKTKDLQEKKRESISSCSWFEEHLDQVSFDQTGAQPQVPVSSSRRPSQTSKRSYRSPGGTPTPNLQ